LAAQLIETLRHGLFAAKLWACGDAFAQDAVPPITDETEFFHIRIWFPIVPAICLFVLGLLIFCLKPGDIPSSPFRTKPSCRREKLGAAK
jgi:hypothetical protein